MLRPVALVSAALVLAAVSGPPPASAQDTLLTAGLLKRLGEAVDGYRTGRAYWVVVCLDPPHRVLSVVEERARAESIARQAGGCYRLFGPYRSTRDPGTEAAYFVLPNPCPGRHMPNSECPDTTFAEANAVPMNQVDSLGVAVYARGVQLRRTYRGGEVDALFFTLAAIDKFALPYYGRLHGAAHAAAMRERYLRGIRPAR